MCSSDIFSRKNREMNLRQWINFTTSGKIGESTRETLDLFKMAYDERNSKTLSVFPCQCLLKKMAEKICMMYQDVSSQMHKG